MGWESEEELAAGIQRHALETARKRQLAEARKRAAKNRTDPDGEVRNRTASRGAACIEGASAPRRSSAFACPAPGRSALRSPGASNDRIKDHGIFRSEHGEEDMAHRNRKSLQGRGSRKIK